MSEPGRAGEFCYGMVEELFPICRSITGQGLRDTLSYFQSFLPEMNIQSVRSGEPVFDWTVPDEWTIRDAYIADDAGKRVVDFRSNNLHVVGYSEPVDIQLDLDELQKRLHSLPDQPDAIPYLTSYYRRTWGFCLSHRQRMTLPPGRYRAVIDSDLKPGILNYGEIFLPGDDAREVLLSTYVCHPSMANNELSGPTVTCALAIWLKSLPRRRYSYRIVYLPETIGSLAFLSRNLAHLRTNVVAGFVVTCVGDNREYSFLPSRAGNTLADHAAIQALTEIAPGFKKYTWLDRGSDERQYCAPGIDLPVALVMRSKFYEYPQYHTSLDNLEFVSPAGLQGGFEALRRCIFMIENNCIPEVSVLGEPQLGKRGLYPSLSAKDTFPRVKCMMDALSYCDGKRDLLEISRIVGQRFGDVLDALAPLMECGLVKIRH
jgi:aminopeptidase-like protein